MALLRTCRQIYAEAALIPFKANTFSFWSFCGIEGLVKKRKRIQCNQISTIQLETGEATRMGALWGGVLGPALPNLSSLLPGLRHVNIRARLFSSTDQVDNFVQHWSKRIEALRGHVEVTSEVHTGDSLYCAQ